MCERIVDCYSWGCCVRCEDGRVSSMSCNTTPHFRMFCFDIRFAVPTLFVLQDVLLVFQIRTFRDCSCTRVLSRAPACAFTYDFLQQMFGIIVFLSASAERSDIVGAITLQSLSSKCAEMVSRESLDSLQALHFGVRSVAHHFFRCIILLITLAQSSPLSPLPLCFQVSLQMSLVRCQT